MSDEVLKDEVQRLADKFSVPLNMDGASEEGEEDKVKRSPAEEADDLVKTLMPVLGPFYLWLEKEKDAMLCTQAPYKAFTPHGEVSVFMPADLSVGALLREFLVLQIGTEEATTEEEKTPGVADST